MPLSHQHLKAFRLQLAEQLVGGYNNGKRLGRLPTRPAHPPPSPQDQGPQTTRTALHLPSHMDKKRRCIYCHKYREPPQRHNVVWYCKECPGQPTLCITGKEDGSDCGTSTSCDCIYPHALFLLLCHPPV